MEDRLFLYLAAISKDHSFIVWSHMLLVCLIALVFSIVTIRSLRTVPTGFQNVAEMYLSGVIGMAKDVLGEDNAKKYLPLVATIGIYVFLANVIGIIPGFESPTANVNFTLSLALMVFVYYNFEGIRTHGIVKYFAHFMGPVPWLALLVFPIEVVSHFSRIVSLSFRLFGNIKGDDLFLIVLLMLAPWIVPLSAFSLLTLMAFLQSFIFMMLTLIYLSGAILVHEEH